MTSTEWAVVALVGAGHLVVLVAAARTTAGFLVKTSLAPWKITIAAIFLGHVGSSILVDLIDASPKAASPGLAVSRLLGIPLLAWWIPRNVRQWRNKAGTETDRSQP